MIELKLVDKSFIMCGPSMGTGSTGKAPTKIKWNNQTNNDIIVFTDYCLQEVFNYNNKIKIALILEPISVVPQIYQWIKQNYQYFNYVLTFDNDLLKISNKFIFSPNATGHWLKDEDIKIHNKSKLISIFASNKNTTDGHILRHSIITNYRSKIDGLFGRGSYGFLNDKADGLRDYAFHITVENTRKDYYFSEKLIDALLTGCIPIYSGCPSINNFFNSRGILQFSNIKEFDKIIKFINFDYYKMLYDEGIIQENFKRAMNYLYPEDYIYDKLFKNILEEK